MAPKQERIVWIDLARGLAILSVIALHAGILPYWYFFSAFQLPLFAFLTGYATNWMGLDFPKLGQRWIQWGGVYILAGLASLIPWTLVLLGYGTTPAVLDFPLGTNLGELLRGVAMPSNGPLWFLLPFALSITFAQIFFSLRNYQKWAFVLCLIPFTSTPVKAFFLALILGAFWKERGVKVQLKPMHFVALAVFFLIAARMNGSTDLHYGRLANPFLYAITSMSGILLTIHITSLIASIANKKWSNFFQWLGQQSLALFVLHWPAMLVVVFLFWKTGILSYFEATPGLVGTLMPFEKTLTGVTRAGTLWLMTFTWTIALSLGFSEIFRYCVRLLKEIFQRTQNDTLKVTIVGHVCVDHNISEHARYTAPGGPATFIHKIYSQLPNNHVEIIAPYGKDFLSLAPETPLHKALPIREKTLVYSNDSSGKIRVQKALQRSFAEPPIFTPELLGSLQKSNIVFFSPLTPQFELKDLEIILKQKREDQLFVLLPQGYFRDFASDDTVIARDGKEVDALALYFDVIVVSEQDHPEIESKADHWADSTRIITTLGEKGARYQYKDQDFIVPTEPVLPSEILDSVGSGDIFSSAFAYAFFKERDAYKALAFANTIARQCLFFSAKDIKIVL